MRINIATADDIVLEPLEDETARSVAQHRDRHRTVLWLSLAVVGGAVLLQTRDGSAVGPTFLPGVNLPTLCGSRALLGVECPGCGLTRSFLALASGNFAESLKYHRLGWLMALVVALQFPYRIFCLRELHEKIPTRTWPIWFGYALLATLVINRRL